KTALEIPDAVHTTGGQDGVLGLALHPDLLTGRGRDHVYLAHTYRTDAGPRTKIVRYTYDPDGERLHSPKDLITWMPAGHDHRAAKTACWAWRSHPTCAPAADATTSTSPTPTARTLDHAPRSCGIRTIPTGTGCTPPRI